MLRAGPVLVQVLSEFYYEIKAPICCDIGPGRPRAVKRP